MEENKIKGNYKNVIFTFSLYEFKLNKQVNC